MTRKGILTVWLALASISAGLSIAHAANVQFRTGEMVVKLKSNSKTSISGLGIQAHSLLGELGQKYAVDVIPFATDKRFVKVVVKDAAKRNLSMEQLLIDVQNSPYVEYAEPNYILHAIGNNVAADPSKTVTPNDQNFGLDWGLLNTGQADKKGQAGTVGVDIGATKAWVTGTGSKSVVVAVIDTGVDYSHEDLKDNIFANTKEIAGNGIDDDGNGFIDDVRGWNFEGKNNDPMDDNKHGTHCSGTIGAQGNNGIGTAGVSWNVSILPIKFLSASGSGSLADALEGIKYATKMGVNVMSNSWGGGGFSQAMHDAIKEARDKGILFIAAAGNDGNDNDSSASYPAGYNLENVISVAATDNRDQKASWSNYGRRTVHLAAPGVNIYSTVPMTKGGYDTFSGTSMATPHVAGATALLWSIFPKMTFAEIRTRLLSTVDPVRTLKRKVSTGGRLNVYNAINNIVPPRSEPAPELWKSVAQVVESQHPYHDSMKLTFTIKHEGAKFMRVHFSKIETEASYDFVKIKSPKGEVFEELSGNVSDYTTDYVEGDTLLIDFTSDTSNQGYGFQVDHYDFID